MDHAAVVDLSQYTILRGGVLEASVALEEPLSHLRLRLPRGEAGRAEAVLDEQSWAAKHYWQEAPGLMTYEFDEPLPAGPVLLRVPFAPA
jgi:hypothetical protein